MAVGFQARTGGPSVRPVAAARIDRQPSEFPAIGQDLDASAGSPASSAIVFRGRADSPWRRRRRLQAYTLRGLTSEGAGDDGR